MQDNLFNKYIELEVQAFKEYNQKLNDNNITEENQKQQPYKKIYKQLTKELKIKLKEIDKQILTKQVKESLKKENT